MILLGTATSVGVPVIGCDCDVCKSSNAKNHRTRTGVFVQAPEGNILIDTPPELRMQLIREQIDIVHGVVYTHSHADHLFGLDDLRLFGYRLDRPIPLYCEELVEEQIRMAYSYAFEPPKFNDHHFATPKLELRRITLSAFDLLGQRIQPIRLMHGKLPILGFRINDVAFCTDVSVIPDESWPLLENLDVLIIDALRERPHPTHLSVGEAIDVIQRVKPKRAYLTHISHSLEYEATNAQLPDSIELAYDGLRIPL
ncbi:MAG: MBL fold metallo-hydrolase [Planctomycetaceae bacterium]|nr:MBL fold metallo-hydrolase [Planctomycetaceae bacterium]